jgi:hypothetical protein
MPFQNAVGQVLQVAHTTGGDHRNAQRIADGAGHAQVEAVLHAVLVHAGQQDLAGTQAFHLLRPLHRIQPGRLAPAVGEDLPARRFTRAGDLLGVDGDDDALRTETVRRLADELRVEHRGGVDRDLVGTGVEQVADVLHGAHATAHGQRDEHLAGHALDGMQGGVAAIDAGGDVEKGDLVGTLLVVATGDFHRVAGIADVLELDALDHPAVVHVQARDDALGQCHGRSSALVVVAESLGLGDVEGAFVDGTAGDGADDARRLGVQQRLDVAQVVDAAGGDHRDRVASASALVKGTLQPCIMPSLAMSV